MGFDLSSPGVSPYLSVASTVTASKSAAFCIREFVEQADNFADYGGQNGQADNSPCCY